MSEVDFRGIGGGVGGVGGLLYFSYLTYVRSVRSLVHFSCLPRVRGVRG